MELFLDIMKVITGVIIGLIAGFFLARKFMMKYLQKNPPINEDVIKMLMSQMGRTPNQKQINQIMKQMKNMK